MKKLMSVFFAIFFYSLSLQGQEMTLGNPWIDYNYTNKAYGRDNMFHLRSADNAERLFDFEEAFFSLENAVNQNPQSADALLNRAIFKKKLGMVTEAAEDVKLANTLNPYAADLYGYNGSYAILNVLYNDPASAVQGLTMTRKMGYYYQEIDRRYMEEDNSLDIL